MKEIVAFNFQEAGAVVGIFLGHHMRFHTVSKQVLFCPLIQLFLIFILQMLSCLQGSLVKKLC